MLRRVILLLVLGLVAVGAVAWVQRASRADEWEHGGDGVTVQAEIATASAQDFPAVLAAHGGPADQVPARTPQSVVAHVTWQGAPTSGTYAFVLLDGRLSPPAPLRGYGGWWPADPEGTGPHWDGRYEELSAHYPWLAGTASKRTGSGWRNDTDALGVPATEQGSATLAYYLDRADLPAERPAEELVLAMVLVGEDGEVRWARQVPLHAG